MNLWTHFQNLADSVQTKFAAYEAWTSWTPTWDTAASGGFTSVGAGFGEGFYQRRGTVVHVEFRIELGAGFAVTAGTFALLLPIIAYNSWSGTAIQSTIGTWTARNNSDPFHYSGSIGVMNASGTKATLNGSWDTAAPKSRVTDLLPVPWASGDVLSGSLAYRTT